MANQNGHFRSDLLELDRRASLARLASPTDSQQKLSSKPELLMIVGGKSSGKMMRSIWRAAS